MKDLFIVGDVHGCYFTLLELLKEWNNETEQLILVGDLIDRGNFSPETVNHIKQIQQKHPDTIVLLGNHECEAISAARKGDNTWFRDMGAHTLSQYTKGNFDFIQDVMWFESLPLKWENEHVFISHAGLCETSTPYDIHNRQESVIWTRKPLKNIGKLQIHGHTPHYEHPKYTAASNSWNIDSAACYEHYLTGMKLTSDGTSHSFIKLDLHKKDYPTTTFDKM